MEQREAAIELLTKLVGIDTTSAKSNLPLIHLVADHLGALGVKSALTPSESGDKASLFATIGRGDAGGIALSAHSDCVPVTGQSWTSDPFTLTRKNGRLYARGACDMKGFLAAVLAMVPAFLKRKLRVPIHILVSYDEEVGCTGVRPLIVRLGADLPKPALAIVGEPTRMQVVDAHKAIDGFATRVTGREAHSSMPQLGVNAIDVAASMITELGRFGRELRLKRNDRFDPPCTTLQVGQIAGGTAGNIVPRACRFDWQVRCLPGADAQTIAKQLSDYADRVLLPTMRAAAPGTSIDIVHLNHVPGLNAGEGSPAVALALQLAGRNGTQAVSYATEAGLFAQAGIPSVVCGPGDIAQAHAADEFIETAEIDACLTFLARLAEHVRA